MISSSPPASVPPDQAKLVAALRQAGLVGAAAPVLTPLSGGVSSDIVDVDDGARRFVVKSALPKLRVRDDWFADVSRNRVEQAYLRRVGALLPLAVPRVLFADADAGWFAMEYFGAEFANWKVRLLEGSAEIEHARRAGETLGVIHRATWGNGDVAREFATWRNFHQLRVEPFLETTAQRVPDLAPQLLAEAARLKRTTLALVHGDFSPKNMLVRPGRLVLLDAEVAWFGDPAFDPAFLLTHLHLKALLNSTASGAMAELTREFWQAYVTGLGAVHANTGLEARTTRLMLCLLLARVHGKSPVEYLSESRREFVVAFVRTHLPRPPAQLEAITAAWLKEISHQ